MAIFCATFLEVNKCIGSKWYYGVQRSWESKGYQNAQIRVFLRVLHLLAPLHFTIERKRLFFSLTQIVNTCSCTHGFGQSSHNRPWRYVHVVTVEMCLPLTTVCINRWHKDTHSWYKNQSDMAYIKNYF